MNWTVVMVHVFYYNTFLARTGTAACDHQLLNSFTFTVLPLSVLSVPDQKSSRCFHLTFKVVKNTNIHRGVRRVQGGCREGAGRGERFTSQLWKTVNIKAPSLTLAGPVHSAPTVSIIINSSSSKSRGPQTTNCNYLSDTSLSLPPNLLLMCLVKVHTRCWAKISLINNFY